MKIIIFFFILVSIAVSYPLVKQADTQETLVDNGPAILSVPCMSFSNSEKKCFLNYKNCMFNPYVSQCQDQDIIGRCMALECENQCLGKTYGAICQWLRNEGLCIPKVQDSLLRIDFDPVTRKAKLFPPIGYRKRRVDESEEEEEPAQTTDTTSKAADGMGNPANPVNPVSQGDNKNQGVNDGMDIPKNPFEEASTCDKTELGPIKNGGGGTPIDPPVASDPAKTDSAKTDPAKTDPAKTDPAKTDPAKADPAKADPTKTDPTKADPAKADPAKADPAKADPAKADPAKAEPAKSADDGKEKKARRLKSSLRSKINKRRKRVKEEEDEEEDAKADPVSDKYKDTKTTDAMTSDAKPAAPLAQQDNANKDDSSKKKEAAGEVCDDSPTGLAANKNKPETASGNNSGNKDQKQAAQAADTANKDKPQAAPEAKPVSKDQEKPQAVDPTKKDQAPDASLNTKK